MYLCCLATTLGQAVISLGPLITDDSLKQPKVIEGLFLLKSENYESSTDGENPVVGVSMVLRGEEEDPGLRREGTGLQPQLSPVLADPKSKV